MKTTKLIFTALIMFSCIASASARTWTYKDGRTLNGEFSRVEGKWIVIKLDNGNTKPISLADLSAEDFKYARNLAAIFGTKPAAIETTDPAMRVHIPGEKPTTVRKPIKRKSPRTKDVPGINPQTEPMQTPEPAPEIEIEPAATPSQPAPTPAVFSKIIIPPKPKGPGDESITPNIAKTDSDRPQVLMSLKKKVDTTRRPSKFIPATDIERFANALENSLNKNRSITLYFLVLCLLILVHKMHMPHLYKTQFKPTRTQTKGTQKKEFEKDDDRERFRNCPFCGVTNPTTAEQCHECGKYLK